MFNKSTGAKASRAERILTAVFAVSLAVYIGIFATAFADLPLNISQGHQFLLRFFHAIPLFSLQMLLCLRAKWRLKILVPLAVLVIPGFVFLCLVQWAAMGWVLVLCWIAAPAAACLLAWMLWAVRLALKSAGSRRDE